MKEIQAYMGHSSYSCTANIYSHLDSNTREKSTNVISKVLT